jgi:putative SOS response-associated peptidase YedK
VVVLQQSGLRRSIAGIGENWKNPEGEWVRAFALLITPANEPIGCIHAWNTVVDPPRKIMSIARREWANEGHST